MKVELSQAIACKRCGHRWIPRITEVRVCPRCKSVWFDKEKTQNVPDADIKRV